MDTQQQKVISTNKKAYHDYHIIEKIEAGIELTGTEVKSLRTGHAHLKDSYARIKDGEIYLIKTHIPPYKFSGSHDNHEPERERRLLLHKKEILKLKKSVDTKGVTLIPLQLYFTNRGKIKVELGVAKGKRQYDKRIAIAEKDQRREMERTRKDRY
ncbi:MAG TPA: SsrA-binding protein SmpB [Candidatus Marinimicrobia bacterium]|nr:SsrA-binding protein SmpB [Candidatus Neomarinimicrobiota bacterium]